MRRITFQIGYFRSHKGACPQPALSHPCKDAMNNQQIKMTCQNEVLTLHIKENKLVQEYFFWELYDRVTFNRLNHVAKRKHNKLEGISLSHKKQVDIEIRLSSLLAFILLVDYVRLREPYAFFFSTARIRPFRPRNEAKSYQLSHN
jgi:hypothetical protein